MIYEQTIELARLSDGESGQSSFIHIKYSNDKKTFTGNDGEDVGIYLGIYTDDIEEDSMDFNKYKWSKIVGADGKQGEDGVSIISVDEHYAVSSSNTAEPTTWTDTVPEMTTENKYLWNYETINYSNGDHSDTTKRVIGIYGDKGNDGTSVTVKSTEVTYGISDDTITKPTSWSKSIPTVEAGKYLWSKSVTTYSDGKSIETYSYALQGIQGEQGIQGIQGERGEQGIQGETGENGKTSYFHIKYSSVEKPTSASQMIETPSTYIGTYVDYTSEDSTDPSKYTWSRFQGVQGEKGEQGIKGTDGTNGKTSYLHIAYADSADGKIGFDISNSTNKLYIGQYTDFTPDDSTDPTKYLWTKIKGEQGVQGVKGNDGITYYTWIKYADSPTSGMSDNPSGKKYLGVATNKTSSTESTNYSDYTWSLIKGDTGEKGDPGATGNGIKSIAYTYACTTTQTAPDSKNITATTMPTLDATNKYLWQKEVITYTNETSQTTVLLLAVYGNTGAKGDKGNDGTSVTVKSTAITYGTSTNSSTKPTSWSSTMPSVAQGQYLWTKTVVTYSDGKTTETYTYSLQGKDGTSITIKSKSVEYAVSTNGTTAPTSGWQASIPTVANGSFLWTKSTVTYSDNTSAVSYSVGYKGTNGTNGTSPTVSSTKNEYQQSTSGTTVPTGTWETTPPTATAGQYMWTKTTTTYSDNKTSVSYNVSKNGVNGSNGKSIGTITNYYLATSASTGVTTSTGGWTTTVQNVSADKKYLWNYEVIKYSDNTVASTSTPCIIGAYGDKGNAGATGTGIDSIIKEFYLSTSSTTQVGGSWQTTMPTWATGKYLWTREKIVYKNPASTVYTEPKCDSSWEAIDNLQVGAVNMIRNAKTMEYVDYGIVNDVKTYAALLSADGKALLSADGDVLIATANTGQVYIVDLPKASTLADDSLILINQGNQPLWFTYADLKQAMTGGMNASNTYTKTQADSKFQPKGNYLTAVPDKYVTDDELTAKGYATNAQLAKKVDVAQGTSNSGRYMMVNASGNIVPVDCSDTVHKHSNKSVLDGITASKVNDWNNKSDFTGSYNDLTNKPVIPTKISQLTNDSNFLTGVVWGDIGNKPATFAPSTHTHTELATKATVNKDTDWDEVTASGIYNVQVNGWGANKHNPSGAYAYGTLIVHAFNSSHIIQIYISHQGDVFTRETWSGKDSYVEWNKVYTTKNKPSKSDVGLGNVDNTADANKAVKSATNDSKGQNISTTYIKSLAISGKTITYTRGDNTTGTIVTQDTTYVAMTDDEIKKICV